MAEENTDPRVQRSNVTRHRCQWCQTQYEAGDDHQCDPGIPREDTDPRVQRSNVRRHRCQWCQTQYEAADGHQCDLGIPRENTDPRTQHANGRWDRRQWHQTENQTAPNNSDPARGHECRAKDCRLWKLTQRAAAELRKIGLPIPEAIETYDRRLFILNADMGGDPDFLGLNDHPKARETLLGILVDKSGEPRADTAPETLVEDGGNLPQEGGKGDDRVPKGPFQGHRYRFLRKQDIDSLIIDNETNYLRVKRAL